MGCAVRLVGWGVPLWVGNGSCSNVRSESSIGALISVKCWSKRVTSRSKLVFVGGGMGIDAGSGVGGGRGCVSNSGPKSKS